MSFQPWSPPCPLVSATTELTAAASVSAARHQPPAWRQHTPIRCDNSKIPQTNCVTSYEIVNLWLSCSGERGPRGRAHHFRLRGGDMADVGAQPLHPADGGAAVAAPLLGAQVEAPTHPQEGATRQGHQRFNRGTRRKMELLSWRRIKTILLILSLGSL